MADVTMTTPEGEQKDVPEALVQIKLAAGWQLFEAQNAPSTAQPIPVETEDVWMEVPEVDLFEEE